MLKICISVAKLIPYKSILDTCTKSLKLHVEYYLHKRHIMDNDFDPTSLLSLVTLCIAYELTWISCPILALQVSRARIEKMALPEVEEFGQIDT